MLLLAPDEAALRLVAMEQFYAALGAREWFGDHICLALHEPTKNGSPDQLVDLAVDELGAITQRWTDQISEALEGANDEAAIRRVLAQLEQELQFQDAADLLAEQMDFGLMLGGLDAQDDGARAGAGLITFRTQDAPPVLTRAPREVAANLWDQRKVLPKAEYDALNAEMKRRAFSFAGAAKDDLLDTVHAELGKRIREGTVDLREFKRFAKERMESAGWTAKNKTHAETLLRTNVVSAMATGRHAQMTQPAVMAALPYWQIRGVKDARQRPTHRAADGIVLPANHEFWRKAYPPFGYNCFLPGSVVRGIFTGASRALYSGKAVELTTAKGRRLSVTANHPVLTARGFMPACQLREGDQLVSYRDEPGVQPLGPSPKGDENHPPAKIEEVFSALAQAGGPFLASNGPHDFHGEAKRFRGEVEVVGSYAMLPQEWEPSGEEELPEVLLKATHALNLGTGSGGAPLDGVLLTSPGFPGPSALPLDGISVSLQRLPFRELRIAAPTELDSVLTENASNGLTRGSELIGQLLEVGHALVELDEVRNVREFDFCGHVYDVETTPGWLSSDSIVVSNCRCRVISRTAAWLARTGTKIGPVPKGLPDPGFTSGIVQVPAAIRSLAPRPQQTKAAPPPTAIIEQEVGLPQAYLPTIEAPAPIVPVALPAPKAKPLLAPSDAEAKAAEKAAHIAKVKAGIEAKKAEAQAKYEKRKQQAIEKAQAAAAKEAAAQAAKLEAEQAALAAGQLAKQQAAETAAKALADKVAAEQVAQAKALKELATKEAAAKAKAAKIAKKAEADLAKKKQLEEQKAAKPPKAGKPTADPSAAWAKQANADLKAGKITYVPQGLKHSIVGADGQEIGTYYKDNATGKFVVHGKGPMPGKAFKDQTEATKYAIKAKQAHLKELEGWAKAKAKAKATPAPTSAAVPATVPKVAALPVGAGTAVDAAFKAETEALSARVRALPPELQRVSAAHLNDVHADLRVNITAKQRRSAFDPAPPPTAWSKAWEERKRPKLALGNPKKELLSKEAQEAAKRRGGFSYVGDGQQIEKMDVNITTEVRGGKPVTVARFKLTEGAGQEAMRKAQWEQSQHYFLRNNPHTDKAHMPGDEGRDVSHGIAHRLVGTKEGARVSFIRQPDVKSRNLHALHNMVEIQVDGELTAETIKRIESEMARVGVKGGLTAPSAADVEAYKKAKVLSQMTNGARRVMHEAMVAKGAALSAAEIDAIFETFATDDIRRVYKSTELVRDSAGNTTLYSSELAKLWEQSGVRYLRHGMNPNPEVLRQMLIVDPESGLLSSAERYKRGAFVQGASTGPDFGTGGADGVFVRISDKAPREGRENRESEMLAAGSSSWMIEIDPSELGRLDTYAFESDLFGAAGVTQTRQGVDDFLHRIFDKRLMGDNEVMFQRSVHPRSWRRVRIQDGQVESVRAMFRKAGIRQVNGIPLEDFITE